MLRVLEGVFHLLCDALHSSYNHTQTSFSLPQTWAFSPSLPPNRPQNGKPPGSVAFVNFHGVNIHTRQISKYKPGSILMSASK